MTVHTQAAPATPRNLTIRRGTALGVGLALASTVTVFMVGNLGAPIRVVTGWDPAGADLRLTEVVLSAALSVVLGGMLLGLIERRRADGFRLWTAGAATAAIVSALPLLRLEIDAGSKIALVAMHLLTGASAVTGHRITRRRARSLLLRHREARVSRR